MSATDIDTDTLPVSRREPEGSRATRRLRREGLVPGVVYGGGQDAVAFAVNERTLRHVLAGAGAVVQLSIDGESASPVMLKELIRHPVDGHTVHVDLLRVRLDQAIQATVTLELVGEDEAPGVKLGGILEHVVRELNVEALPGDIPDSIQHDVSALEIGDTLLVAGINAPTGVTILDDPDLLVATLSAPRLQAEVEDEIEQETEVVGEAEKAEAQAEAAADEGAEA